jgi:hypothetical protein
MLFKPDSAVRGDEQMGKPLLSFAFHLHDRDNRAIVQ